MFLCLSTYDTTRVLFKVTEFRDFETGNSEEKHMICVYLIFDINNNLMFEAYFVLEPCNFSILLLETL